MLRRIQREMSRHMHVVLPIMTGIDPTTYEHQSSEGKNIVLGFKGSEAIITVDDALKVAQSSAEETPATNQ